MFDEAKFPLIAPLARDRMPTAATQFYAECVYSASALLTMPSAVIARPFLSDRLSLCLSVCPSVTFRCCVQRNEDTIVRFSASGRTILLVSAEVKFIRIFAGDHLSGVVSEALLCQ